MTPRVAMGFLSLCLLIATVSFPQTLDARAYPLAVQSTVTESPAPDTQGSYAVRSLDSLIDNGLDSGRLVFLFFYIDECGWSKKQMPVIDKLAEEYYEYVVFLRVNGKKDSEAVAKFEVQSYPNMFLIRGRDETGYLYEHFGGFTDFDALEMVLTETLSIAPSAPEQSPDRGLRGDHLTAIGEIVDAAGGQTSIQSMDTSSCTTISSPGIYTLTVDIIDSTATRCMNITSSDVVLDGNGHTIDGVETSNTYGVYVYSPSTRLSNVTVRNLRVKNWYNGIYYRNTDYGNIEDNYPQNNVFSGIYLYLSHYNNITNNIARENLGSFNSNGIYLDHSTNNNIAGNTANSNDYFGIYLTASSGNTIASNTANNQGYGIRLDSSSNNIVDDNWAGGNKNGIYLQSSGDNVVKNNQFDYSYHGIYLGYSHSNDIYGNKIVDNGYIDDTRYDGMRLYDSRDNRIFNNFFNNYQNVVIDFAGIVDSNTWNISRTSGINIVGGPYLGGNYWGDYYGYGYGPSPSCVDNDGDYLCDDSYPLETGNVDYLPLKEFPDSDGDGVPDPEDNCVNIPNPSQTNSDGDDYGDACDNCWYVDNSAQSDTDGDCPAAPYTVDPFCGDACELSDTDWDGIPDVEDNCPTTPNPSQTDSDGDGDGDLCDNCPTVSNPDQVNSDSDSLGNECDNCDYVPNPDQIDTDEDGWGDACDQCPSDPNKAYPGQCGCGVLDTDSDWDGVADCVDGCPDDGSKTDPGVCGCGVPDTDEDNDGYPNCIDNCPDMTNDDQADNDNDGIGDVCDNCPDVENGDQIDADGDWIGDVCDNCPMRLNHFQTDADGDGFGDACDNCPTVSNSDQNNSDGDALGDACDNCWNAVNPDQFDWNANCPSIPYTSDPRCGDACEDSDSDGILDEPDNCPGVRNPDQNNHDGDGFGDACDNCWLKDNPNQEDRDGDCAPLRQDSEYWNRTLGIWKKNPRCGDACDNCMLLTNPYQDDWDIDGVGDACDCNDNYTGENEEGADCGFKLSPAYVRDGTCEISCLIYSCVPLVINGNSRDKIDVVIIGNRWDYLNNKALFLNRTMEIVKNSFLEQEILGHIWYKEKFNFWYFPLFGGRVNDVSGDCEWYEPTHIDRDCPFADVKAIIHESYCRDYRLRDTFSAWVAEYDIAQHECGHALFDLGDQYDDNPWGCGTHYFEGDPHPNIYDSKQSCERQSVHPEDCHWFTNCDDRWWKADADDFAMDDCPGTNVCSYGPDGDHQVLAILDRYVDPPEDEDAKAMILFLNINNGMWTLVNTTIIYGYAPNYFLDLDYFKISLFAANGSLLHDITLWDPTYYSYTHGGAGHWDNVTFSLVLPFKENPRTVKILNKTSGEEMLTVDLSEAVLDFCGENSDDPTCQILDGRAPEPFPTLIVALIVIVIVGGAGTAFLVFSRRSKKSSQELKS